MVLKLPERDFTRRWLVSRLDEAGEATAMDSFKDEADARLYAVLAIHGVYAGYRVEDTEKPGR